MHKVCLYISNDLEEQEKDFESDKEDDLSVDSDHAKPWWMRNRNCNKVIYAKRQNRFSQIRRDDEDLVLNMKNLGRVDDPEEYDLEQKIDLEIKMREGTTKLLAACKHKSQSLEAAKNLLTSNERMSAYMSELQRRKKETPSRGLGYSKISKARLSLSDLRMPLIWRDTDHFKNKGDYRRFAVFCLARVGTEIYDTSLLSPVDRSLTDLTFPDVMLFNNVPPDFEVRLEVYSHILQDDLTMASTSRKIKKTIHSSISRTVGKKLAATLNDELNTGKIGPRFELAATARLTLDEVHDSVRTHDLQIHSTDPRNQLPLFGHFCCRLAAQPNSFVQESCSGELSVHVQDSNEEHFWDSAWGRLRSFNLELWKQRKFFEANQPPFRNLPINKNVTIKTGKLSTEIVITVNNNQKPLATIRLRNVEEQQKWLKCLNQQVEDHRRWKNAAETCLRITSPGSIRNSFMKGLRQGSLYDQTPIIESVAPEVHGTHRRTVQEIFGLTPSTSLSSCASSSSSSTFNDRSNSSGRKTRMTNTRLIN